MTDRNVGTRLDTLESLVEEQQEIIREQRDRIADLEDEDAGGETDEHTDAETGLLPVRRRTLLQSAGLAGLLGMGAGRVAADPQGQIGTGDDPVRTVYTEALGGGLTGGSTVERLAGEGLSIADGELTAPGGIGDGPLTVSGSFGESFEDVSRLTFDRNMLLDGAEDGSVTVSATDSNTDTDTHTDVSDGETTVEDVDDVTFGTSLELTDDGDGTATVDADVEGATNWAAAGDGLLRTDSSYDGIDVTDVETEGLTVGGGSRLTGLTGTGLTAPGGSLGIAPGGVGSTELASDTVTVAGRAVSLGGSTGIAHADLSGISVDDHHSRPSAGTGLAESDGTFAVDASTLVGSFLSADSGALSVDLGAGLEGDADDAVRVDGSAVAGNVLSEGTDPSRVDVNVGNALTDDSGDLAVPIGGIGTTELDTPFADLASLVGSPVTPGATVQSDSTLRFETGGGDRTLELGVPSTDQTTTTAGGNVVAGHPNNTVNDGAVGVVVGGGGNEDSANTAGENYATVGGGADNSASGRHATVSGGIDNSASGPQSTVGGGNGTTASGSQATVGGGVANTAGGEDATVGGGASNTAGDEESTVGGGYLNTAGGRQATVAGGGRNGAGGERATIGGGRSNTASASRATVGGGESNTASGEDATVGGGERNTAGQVGATVPGGVAGAAETDHSFVWNDGTGYHAVPNTETDGLSSNTAVGGETVTGANTFSVSAQNGLRFVTGSASSPSVVTLADDGTNAELTFHSDLPGADATSVDIDSDGRLVKASSSARYKTNIQPLSTDTSDVLELEPRSFEYEDSGQHSTGLVAEEVAEVLPDLVCYDEQDRPDSVKYDRVGVYLVPEVDEHRERLADLDDTSADNERRIETLEAENEQLRERNEALEARLDRIEAELGVDADGQRQGVADD